MDEPIVRGLVIGVTLGLIGLIATLVWRVTKARSEGGRRFRLVLGVGSAAVVLYTLVSIFGIGAALGTAVVLGAIAWVVLGFKKS